MVEKEPNKDDLIHQLEQLKDSLNHILVPSDPTVDVGDNSTPSLEQDEAITAGASDQALLSNFELITSSLHDLRDSGQAPRIGPTALSQSLLLLSPSLKVLAFNRPAQEQVQNLTGANIKVGDPVVSVFPIDDTAPFYQIFGSNSESNSFHFTKKLPFKNGTERWYEINLYPVKTERGAIDRVVFSLEDIEEREAVEEKLRALEVNFRSVFNQAAVSVMLHNIDLELLQANNKFYEMIEYTEQEFKDLPMWGATHPEDVPEGKQLMDQLRIEKIDSFSLEKRYITKTGKIVWVYLTSSLIKDSKDQPSLIISVAQDITARKNAEQELLYKKNELDTFVYRASHDLRGPVASLMGLYNVVQTEFKEESHALEYFEHYHKSVLRLNKILQNLIDLTKIKEKKMSISKMHFKEVVNDCLASLSNANNFEKMHFKIQNEIDFEVTSDRGLLRTIILNLLENSISFIQVDSLQPFVQISTQYESNFIKIEVADNGVGIKPELQSEVFNMFYRANERSGGSGLGLYLVRNAVEKLNGTIQLKSKVGSGTKVSIYIPYHRK
ncbi:MAG: PAS domain-containing sensor histidine kinase [Cyclobacteriaceae bacterium]